MFNILVLGLIPGTNISISFLAWGILAEIFLTALIMVPRIRSHRLLTARLDKVDAQNLSLHKISHHKFAPLIFNNDQPCEEKTLLDHGKLMVEATFVSGLLIHKIRAILAHLGHKIITDL